jgi:hypothetical protein
MSNYNPYRKYCSSWWRFWLNVPADLLAFAKKLYDYAPILWEDRDFDHGYLLRMMRFKIRRMREHMEKHAIIAHAEDYVAEMALADVLLRNVQDEDPDDEWSLHWNQWHNKFKCSASKKVCNKALSDTHRRTERNWKRLWRHMDKYMRGWWD